jgi:hypothetical protein
MTVLDGLSVIQVILAELYDITSSTGPWVITGCAKASSANMNNAAAFE